MAALPAICDTCFTAFPSDFEFTSAQNVSFRGVRCGPCPNCGGFGHVPDCAYNVIGDTIEILSAPERTLAELRQLSKIIYEAQQQHRSSSHISEQIKIELPELSSIGDYLPKTRSELYAFLSLILVAITLIIQVQTSNPPQNTTITVNQVIEHTYNFNHTPQKAIPPHKMGRNEKCPCGSGQKFKKCCGK